MGKRIERLLEKKNGGNQSELAKFVEVSPQAVQQWIAEKTSPRGENLNKAADFLGVTPAELRFGIEPNAEPAGKPRSVRLVKIKGYAKLGENGYYEELDCDGWVESYSPDPDAYGLRVKGDSMFPAIRNGSVVVIEPGGQIVPGEYVAIALRDGQKMVKELIFDRAEEIVVESVNGNGRRTIARQEIMTIHPVAAVVSPSKWRPE